MPKFFAGAKVGDRVLIVTKTERHRTPQMEPRLEWMAVTKVGRQYAEAHREGDKPDKWNSYRFALETGFCRDRGGGMQEVRAWHSEEEWRAHEDAKETFRKFARALQHKWEQAPGVTAADILTAAELLKLDIKP